MRKVAAGASIGLALALLPMAVPATTAAPIPTRAPAGSSGLDLDWMYTWNSRVTYAKGSVVRHKGDVFVARQKQRKGSEPTKQNDGWSFIVGDGHDGRDGAAGPAGAPGTAGPTGPAGVNAITMRSAALGEPRGYPDSEVPTSFYWTGVIKCAPGEVVLGVPWVSGPDEGATFSVTALPLPGLRGMAFHVATDQETGPPTQRQLFVGCLVGTGSTGAATIDWP